MQSLTEPYSEPKRTAQLRSQLASKAGALIGKAESLALGVPGLTIYRHVAPTEAHSSTYQPSIALVAQGKKQVDLGPTQFIYDETHFLLTSLELPVTSRVIEASAQRPYLCVRLALDMAMVRALIGHGGMPPACPASPDSASLAMTTGPTSAPLLDVFGRLLDLQHAPADTAFLGDLWAREIVYRVLQSAEGERLRGIATAGDYSEKTAAAVAWIKEHFARPLRLEELADVAAMGRSTLHRHFRALTAMTPLQYQKLLRLQAARRLMLTEGRDAASAAFEVGYESASQFNREYSRFFGRSPMRDIKALRAPSPY
ncbi:MAG: AraC family transcriptional regulator [Duganella sp.]